MQGIEDIVVLKMSPSPSGVTVVETNLPPYQNLCSDMTRDVMLDRLLQGPQVSQRAVGSRVGRSRYDPIYFIKNKKILIFCI